MNKKKVIVPIVAGVATLGILTGVSYAYFSAKITENNKTETIMKSNELGLTFTGVSEINANSMIPGDSFTKTFSVENTSNRAVTYNIYMQNITNEFNEDLVYTLTDDNGEVVAETALPTTNTGKSYLMTNISIDAGVTKNYTLKIEYKYLDTLQNDYQGSSFNATLGIDTEQIQEEISTLCKRATTLHTEICSQTSTSSYCRADGYGEGDTITYGNLGENGTLSTGDAFDCDVNGDGTYDAETERFYYISDMTNGVTTDSDTAVLIYYNNVSGGEPNNMAAYVYDTSGNNNNGPVTAITQLPTTSQWSNVNLISPTRQITNETGGTTTSAGDLPSFSYEVYSARLLTYQEVYNGCYNGTTAITSTKGLSSKCKYLMENTKYSSSTLATYGGWLETPISSRSNSAWFVFGNSRIVGYNTVSTTSSLGVRPAIEVLKSNISY